MGTGPSAGECDSGRGGGNLVKQRLVLALFWSPRHCPDPSLTSLLPPLWNEILFTRGLCLLPGASSNPCKEMCHNYCHGTKASPAGEGQMKGLPLQFQPLWCCVGQTGVRQVSLFDGYGSDPTALLDGHTQMPSSCVISLKPLHTSGLLDLVFHRKIFPSKSEFLLRVSGTGQMGNEGVICSSVSPPATAQALAFLVGTLGPAVAIPPGRLTSQWDRVTVSRVFACLP